MKTASMFDIPLSLEFGYCRVGTVETRTFQIANGSTVSAKYIFFSEIFGITPKQGKRCTRYVLGTLAPNQKETISISYTATEAKTVIEAVRVSINDDWKTMKATAIGKYPYIGLSTHKLDFGELLTGLASSREIVLKNPSLVPAEFEIEKQDEQNDVLPAFTLDCHKSTIPPNSSYLIKVKYLPTVVGLFSCTRYKVKVKGGNEDEFTCVGQALGVEVSLSAKSVQFGEVTLGNTTNRLLYIRNDSNQPATFQFLNDRKNAFSFSMTEGVIKPHSDFRIVIIFAPTETINFYERVFCIVKNHLILVIFIQ